MCSHLTFSIFSWIESHPHNWIQLPEHKALELYDMTQGDVLA